MDKKMPEGGQKYIVFWTWDLADTDDGITLYRQMNEQKNHDSGKPFKERTYPTSHGSSHGDDSPDWFTIFEATDEQLKNWLEHYGKVLKVKKIMPIISADEFIRKWDNKEITWKYWYRK